MPAARDVQPEGWSEMKVLFDDGLFSVVAGRYHGEECLGTRWNDEAGPPAWHVVPPFLTECTLHGVLDHLLQRADVAHRDAYIDHILIELELLKTRVAQV